MWRLVIRSERDALLGKDLFQAFNVVQSIYINC